MLRFKKIGGAAFLAVVGLIIAPILAYAQTVTAVPLNNLDPSTNGPQAQFVNGSILVKALAALKVLPNSGALPSSATMLMSSSGTTFQVQPAGSARPTSSVSIDADGHAMTSELSPISNLAVTMNLGKLRAIGAANDYLQHANLVNVTASKAADRDLANYDILVYPVFDGRYSGDIFVGFVHHPKPGVKNTIAGCFDSGGGYNGEYYVNPSTFTVVARPCS